MRDALSITRALADGNRLRILALLEGGELCVCQITEVLSLAPSTVSKHLSILDSARLVENRKSGRWVWYRLPDRGAEPAVREALAWVSRYVAGDAVARTDRAKLAQIAGMKPEELCPTPNGS